MEENPHRAPQAQTTTRGKASRLLRHPAFWCALIILLFYMIGIGGLLIVDLTIDDWYRQRGWYVE